MKRYLVLFSLPCILIIPMIMWQTDIIRATEQSTNNGIPSLEVSQFLKRSILPISCKNFVLNLNTTVPILLIDLELLELFHHGDCTVFQGKPVKIGVDVQYLRERQLLEDPRFEVSYFTNETKKDYLDFRTEPRKIIPKNFTTHWISRVEIPSNIPTFSEFWRRARFVECMNLYIPRPGAKVRMQARPAAAALARLRDELVAEGMFPFLNGGTLLGWYRECSVIPHTSDMDVAVFSENFNNRFVEQMQMNRTEFRLSRKFGMVNDSYEMTVAPRSGYKVFIDIFVMYEANDNGTAYNWVGGVGGDGTKYKYTYPLYDPWCAADLLGHIFWVTCTPNKKLVNEYGQLWYQDHPTNKYSWNSSGKNVKKNGKWTKEQMKKVYNVYG